MGGAVILTITTTMKQNCDPGLVLMGMATSCSSCMTVGYDGNINTHTYTHSMWTFKITTTINMMITPSVSDVAFRLYNMEYNKMATTTTIIITITTHAHTHTHTP